MAAVNVAIIKNPINWIIIFLMIFFAMLIAESIFQLAGVKPCSCHSTNGV